MIFYDSDKYKFFIGSKPYLRFCYQ